MRASALPFDDIRDLVAMMPPPPAAIATERSLPRIDHVARFGREWRGAAADPLTRPLVALFVGSHGCSPEWTKREGRAQMAAVSEGTASVARLCRACDVGLRVFELALDHPNGDIVHEAAFDEVACAATVAYGMEAIAGGADLLCLSALGDGADLEAAALCLAVFGGEPEHWAPSTSMLGESTWFAAQLSAARTLHLGAPRDPLEALRRLGGREIAAMVGAVLAARMERTPVILDGLAAMAAGAVLFGLDPHSLDHCLVAGADVDGPVRRACVAMDKFALLGIGGTVAEGCGAALAAGLLKTIWAGA